MRRYVKYMSKRALYVTLPRHQRYRGQSDPRTHTSSHTFHAHHTHSICTHTKSHTYAHRQYCWASYGELHNELGATWDTDSPSVESKANFTISLGTLIVKVCRF